MSVKTRPAASARAPPAPSSAPWEHRGHTVDDPGHPPQPQQDEQAQSLELMLPEHEDDVEDERNHNDDGVQDFKLVVEELQAENEYFKGNLHHKEGQDDYAQVVEHLKGTRKHGHFHPGAEKVQSQLGQHLGPESKEMLKDDGVTSKGPSSPLEEAHRDQIWDNLNIEKNDYGCNTLSTYTKNPTSPQRGVNAHVCTHPGKGRKAVPYKRTTA